jgi:hypothetical protein
VDGATPTRQPRGSSFTAPTSSGNETADPGASGEPPDAADSLSLIVEGEAVQTFYVDAGATTYTVITSPTATSVSLGGKSCELIRDAARERIWECWYP